MTASPLSNPELEAYLVLAQEAMRRVYSDDTPEHINSWMRAQLDRLSGSKDETARLLWDDSFTLYDEIIAKRAAEALLPERERKLLSWPWPSWRKYLDPLEPGLLAVIAGSDGSGKTMYCENIAEHWARQGQRVALLHFELNRSIMLDRRAARATGIPRRALRMGQLSSQERVELERTKDVMRAWTGGITYVHTPGWTVERALAEVRSLFSEKLCDVFIVDYVEKAAPSQRQLRQYGSQIFAREADDVEQIKNFSETMEVPALLLAQLNKAGKGQRFEDLDRTAIRGAGEKTEKANVVVMLHRESLESQTVQVRIDKNTIGPPGSFRQYMETARFLVTDLQDE